LRRGYPIEKNILLTDTLLIEIADEPTRKLLGFSYAVRPFFSMVDKKIIEGMVILPIGDGALLKITESFRKGKQIYL